MSSDGLRIWRPLQFPDVEVHRGRDQANVMPRHVHEEVQLGAFEDGRRRFRIGTRDFDAMVGDVVVIPSGEAHAASSVDRGSSAFHVMFVGKSHVAAAASDLGRDVEIAPFMGKSPIYWRLLTLAYAFAKGTPLEQGTLFLDLMASLLRGETRPLRANGESNAIRRAKDYLDAHIAEPLTLDDLAREVGLTKHYLVRAFRKATGIPPHAYQMQLRIARAKAMLALGKSVSAVAAALSFADQSHFARTFQRYIGMAPSRYQTQLKSTTAPY